MPRSAAHVPAHSAIPRTRRAGHLRIREEIALPIAMPARNCSSISPKA